MREHHRVLLLLLLLSFHISSGGVLRLLEVQLLRGRLLLTWLALECHLNRLSFLVQIYVCNVASIERQILLTHSV